VTPLTPFEFTIVVLAAARATRLVTADTILDGPRDRIKGVTLDELVRCPYCVGWWLSVVTYVVAVLVLGRVHDAPILWHCVMVWAVAGAQSLLNAVDGAMSG
jgi:hypothetical protein